MDRRSLLEVARLRSLNPGQWVWDNGVGYRRNQSGTGGTWYIRFRAPLQGKFPPGIKVPTKQIEERLPNCRNRTQAQRILEGRRAGVFKATFQPATTQELVTLRAFSMRFLEAKRHLRSAGKYKQQLDQHLIPFFGGLPLVAITKSACKAYYAARLDTGVAIATANGELACLKSLFSEAIDAGHCEHNPVRAVRFRPPNNVRDRLLSEAETTRLFDAADTFDDYVRPLVYVLYFTGMRLQEALSLTWRDVEKAHRRILIRTSKSGEGRKVPLHKSVEQELQRWRRSTGGSRWVFPNPTDVTQRIKNVRKGWLRLCAKAKIENLTRHDLRHNLVSMLQARGVADSTIMNITGHKTVATLYRYSHTADATRQAAIDSVEIPSPGASVVELKPKAADTAG